MMMAWQGCLALLGWGLLVGLIWQLGRVLQSAIAASRHMHSIPCANCQFFTNNHRLKCPVHPYAAETADAIGCRDFEPRE